MTSKSGRWVVCFNGEIYNHHELRQEIETTGHVFRGQSDTESLVETIDRWGVEPALHRCNGMFAIAAFHLPSGELWLARDRLGEKPLYWTQQNGLLAFGSQLAALRAVPSLALDVDERALASVLRWSFVPHPHTVYRQVRQLRPGGLLKVRQTDHGTEIAEGQWWSLADTVTAALRQPSGLGLLDAVDELDTLLADAVALRLEADVPLGSFLSGGIDSSLIAAFAQRTLGSTPLRTFTVSMPQLEHDESAYAHAVAAHLGTHHEEVQVTIAEALAIIPRLATIWDEPFADPSMLPSALMCAAAREHLTVCLGGDGGDELFAGYNRHASGARLHDRTAGLPGPLRRGLAGLVLNLRPETLDRIGSRLPRLAAIPNLGDKAHKAAALVAGELQPWEALAGVWPGDSLHVQPYGPRLLPDSVTGNELDSVMFSDTASVLPDQMLVKVDRASMAAPIEVRVPFLDHRLLEWAWRLPHHVKTDGGVGKLVLRGLARRVLPADIIDRPKVGFDPPLAMWLRNELCDWASDTINGSRLVEMGIVDSARLGAMWDQHRRGTRNVEYPLWAVLMTEQWLTEYG